MPDYQKMYTTLFNQVTDVIELLKTAQQKSEDIYIDGDDEKTSVENNNSPPE